MDCYIWQNIKQQFWTQIKFFTSHYRNFQDLSFQRQTHVLWNKQQTSRHKIKLTKKFTSKEIKKQDDTSKEKQS